MNMQEGDEKKLKAMATQEQQDSDRLGRRIIQILALLGGLAGLLIAAFDILASLVGLSSSHIPSGWSELGQVGGVVFLLLGLAGIGGAFLYTRNKKRAAWLLLGSGLLGFPVGYIAWIAFFGFLGWVLWIPPGVLLTVAGLLAWITPLRLRSVLGQGSKTADKGPLDQAIFVCAIFAGIGLLTVILMFAGILFFGAEDYLKGDAGRDQDDFNNANIAGSMGRWDKAVESYDDILSRNQSNVQAWKERSYALEKLGRYNEANESYEKARELELNPENEILRE
jgi:tetratricopeptide (TPR) repeat protein